MKKQHHRFMAILVAFTTLCASWLLGAPAAKAADNNQLAFEYFVGRGLTKEQSAGIVGNLIQESGDPINPGAWQPGGPGRGIAQWSEGDRWDALVGFANAQGRDPWALDVQLDFIWHEFSTTEGYAYGQVTAASTIEEATIAFSHSFERCGTCMDENRIAYAYNVYNLYANGAPAPTPPTDPGLAQGTTTDLLTLRTGAGTGNAALDVLPPGATVPVHCQSRGELVSGTYTSDWWAWVDYNGQSGYVSRAYLRIPFGQPNVPEC